MEPLKGEGFKGASVARIFFYFERSWRWGGGSRPPRVCTQSGRGSWVGVVGARLWGPCKAVLHLVRESSGRRGRRPRSAESAGARSLSDGDLLRQQPPLLHLVFASVSAAWRLRRFFRVFHLPISFSCQTDIFPPFSHFLFNLIYFAFLFVLGQSDRDVASALRLWE